MSGQIEEEILTLERQLFRFPDMAALAARLAAVEQGLAASWYTLGFQWVPPSPDPCSGTGVSAFPSIANCLAYTFNFMITDLGPFGTVTWNGSSYSDTSGTWTGCILYPRPAVGGCGARTIPLFMTLYYDVGLDQMLFKVESINTSGTCPDSGKTCSDFASVNQVALSDSMGNGFGSNPFYIAGSFTPIHFGHSYDPDSGANDSFVWIAANYEYDWFGSYQAIWLPDTLTLVDSVYGTCTLAWDGFKWSGCLAGVAYPGFITSGCAAHTIAIHYYLRPDRGELDIAYQSGIGTDCPVASTCATVLTTFRTGEIPFNAGSSTASPISLVYSYAGGLLNTAVRTLYHNAATTITITP